MSAAEKLKTEKESVRHNDVTMIGEVHEVDLRDSGAAMIWVNAGTRDEEKMHNSPVPAWFTPVFAARIPAKVMDKIDPALLVSGTLVVCDGQLQGIKREVDGKPFYTTEVQITRIRPMSKSD
jgi:hypothetical protein